MKLSAKSRFTTIMVVTASTSMLLVGALAWFEGRRFLEEAAFTHLTGERVAKARQIENYFQTMRDQLIVLSEDRTITTAMVQLSRGFRALGGLSLSPENERSLEDYYTQQFIPRLSENLAGDNPEFAIFQPRGQTARYLQYHYIANKPDQADAAGEHSFAKAGDGSDYSDVHEQYHKGVREFQQRFGYYDVFLIDFDSADVIYSVAKEMDFGTNLLDGPYRSTGLAEVVRKVRRDPHRRKVQIVDFEPYAPSYNAPASFIAAPVYNGPHVVGIIALQIPVDKIQDVMTSQRNWKEEGLGETGETYIVGGDLLMRTDSRFLLEDRENYFEMIRSTGISDEVIQLIDKLDTTILLQPVQTRGARAALTGDKGYFVATDYRGVSVLSTYSKLDINGLEWGIVSEIDEEEAFSNIERLLRHILISTAIFIPVVAYLSFLLSQGFMRPVQQLVTTARCIRQSYDIEAFEPDKSVMFESDGASEYVQLGDEMNLILEQVRMDRIETQKRKTEHTDLVAGALPVSVAERFRSGEKVISDQADQATAIYIQLENFRSAFDTSNMHNTMALQTILDSQVHKAAHKHGVDLFNQMGMNYMGVCGLTMPYLNHFDRAMQLGRDVFDIVAEFNSVYGAFLAANISVEVGPMFGGLQVGHVVDYDILGTTVYCVQEIGYTGTSGLISTSEVTVQYCKDHDLHYSWEKSPATINMNSNELTLWDVSADNIAAMR